MLRIKNNVKRQSFYDSLKRKKSKSITSILMLKDLPYLLVLVIAIIGFQFNYIVKSLLNKPTIEYKIDKIVNNDTVLAFVLKIENITENIKFDTIDVACMGENDIDNFIFFNDDPRFGHNSLGTPIPHSGNDTSSKQISFTIPFMQPGDYIVDTIFTKIVSKITEDKVVASFRSKNVAYFKEKDFSTYLIKNKFSINIAFLFVLLLVFILYFFKFKNNILK